ncbi:MAG: hypothetical protein WC889_17515, partial [Myxococcota bacterium]
LNPTAAKSAFKLEHVLSFHPKFIETIARFIERGNRLVYVMGNHDRELHFPEVQKVFSGAIASKTVTGAVPPESIVYEPWFYHVPGELYAEHGNQYDFYSSFRYVLSPVVKQNREEALALPMGNLSNRYLLTRMGFFNPFSSDFIMNIYRYLEHWLKYYAFSRRWLFVHWFFGSILVMIELLREKKLLLFRPQNYPELIDRTAGAANVPPEMLEKLETLMEMPITNRFYRIVREFWIDRLLLSLAFIGGTVVLALVPIPLWIKLTVPLMGFPLVYFFYEWMARGESVLTIDEDIPNRARMIAGILKVRVVLFGHTHKPCHIPLGRDINYINTGTWAPVISREKKSRMVEGLRNYAFISICKEDGTTRVEFGSWQ